jgi:hypothetical protein
MLYVVIKANDGDHRHARHRRQQLAGGRWRRSRRRCRSARGVPYSTGILVRQSNLARRKAIGTYDAAVYVDYKDEDGDNFPDSWKVRTVLAAGMNDFPDHTEDYKVNPSLKTPTCRNH